MAVLLLTSLPFPDWTAVRRQNSKGQFQHSGNGVLAAANPQFLVGPYTEPDLNAAELGLALTGYWNWPLELSS